MLLEKSSPSTNYYEIIEKFFLSYGAYQLLIYTSLSIIDDISKDSTLMLLSLLKYCLLYKETGSEQLKVLINEKIDNQLSSKVMNSFNTEALLMNLKENIDCIDKVYLQAELIVVEHDLELYQLQWRLSILLRLLK
ncbi:hypothetical protein SALIVA_0541 [Streptococcus salivarius JIM8777]|jgi:hypothetical protein|nr:hypothetical protein [Streptococcus salivarius]MDU2326702.1 hypothetical protein [Streptococcus salivarius]CCB94872.1 hypothetical protein SALIVA_0541 [Streptococcus salivarius JIM8777]